MSLPFTRAEFLRVFAEYHAAVGPAPFIAWALGLGGIGLVVRGRGRTDRAVGGILAAFWLWTGLVYHIGFFARINPAAYVFGTLYIVQALAFALASSRDRLAFVWRWDLRRIIGAFLVLYAIGLYPLLGQFMGHEYPAAPSFGITPCPLTIYTLGLLLWADRLPWWLVPIPIAWTAVGSTAAWRLGMWEDLAMLAAALLALGLWLVHREPFRGEADNTFAE